MPAIEDLSSLYHGLVSAPNRSETSPGFWGEKLVLWELGIFRKSLWR